jgi:hypothetical protein
MDSLELGQNLEIDVSGLGLPGAQATNERVRGVIVDLVPGAITVRLELDDGERLVTVSSRRIQQ